MEESYLVSRGGSWTDGAIVGGTIGCAYGQCGTKMCSFRGHCDGYIDGSRERFECMGVSAAGAVNAGGLSMILPGDIG
jgi:hypothetical protein